MRIVVVGGGVIGLLTAMECVRAGARVDLVDQAGIPSPSATSNDLHRVVRALHRGDAALTTAAAHAHEGWLDVERRLGARFYHRVGVLTAMAAQDVETSHAMVTAAGLPARALTAAELSARYPQIRFPPGRAAVFEPAAGAVLAGQALLRLARWMRDQPAVRLYPHRRVVAVDGGRRRAAGRRYGPGRRPRRRRGGAVVAGPAAAAGRGSDAAAPDHAVVRARAVPAAWAGMPAVLGLGDPVTHG